MIDLSYTDSKCQSWVPIQLFWCQNLWLLGLFKYVELFTVPWTSLIISFLAQTFILPVMFFFIVHLIDSETFILQDSVYCVFSSVKLSFIQPSGIDDTFLSNPLVLVKTANVPLSTVVQLFICMPVWSTVDVANWVKGEWTNALPPRNVMLW